MNIFVRLLDIEYLLDWDPGKLTFTGSLGEPYPLSAVLHSLQLQIQVTGCGSAVPRSFPSIVRLQELQMDLRVRLDIADLNNLEST